MESKRNHTIMWLSGWFRQDPVSCLLHQPPSHTPQGGGRKALRFFSPFYAYFPVSLKVLGKRFSPADFRLFSLISAYFSAYFWASRALPPPAHRQFQPRPNLQSSQVQRREYYVDC